jgi:hypothetical protein
MAVSEVTKMFVGQTGNRTAKERSYEAAWMVVVTDPKDGPKIVTDAVKEWLGKPWTGFSNDVDSTARCESLTPSRVPDTRLVWLVKGTWKTEDPGDNNSGDGGGIEFDPTKWRDEVEVGSAKVTVPVDKATILTDLPKIRRPKNSVGPVVNAAGDVFDPPIEKEESHQIIRITKYEGGFPSSLAATYDNAINADGFTISKPGLQMDIKRYTAKMEPITGSLNWHEWKDGKQFMYWKNVYELHIKRAGWRVEVVNRGRNRRAGPGDPNGQADDDSAKFISPGEIAQKKKFRPPLAKIKDDDDFPVGNVLLDLDGNPLQYYEKDATYIMYGLYFEVPFNLLNL